MAYDADLRDGVRALLSGYDDVTEKGMFGGVAFLRAGNMAVGLLGDDLIVRLSGPDGDMALGEPHTRPFDITGKPFRGWVMVDRAGWSDRELLADWVARGYSFAGSLPPK